MRIALLALLLAACDAGTGAPSPAAPTPASPAPPKTATPWDGFHGPVVTATGVALDGKELGPSPTAAQLAALPRDAVALGFTDDAPATRVLAVATTLWGSGHARVDFTALAAGTRQLCSAKLAGEHDAGIPIVVARGGLAIGGASPVAAFRHDKVAGARIAPELLAPFFTGDPDGTSRTSKPIVLAVDDAVTGAELAYVLEQSCTGWLRVAPPPGPHEIYTLPRCRKLVPKPDVDGLPGLWAFDGCYSTFDRHPGPKGTVTMSFDVEPTGKLSHVAVKSTGHDVDRCITWLLGETTLPNPPAIGAHVRATMECNTRCCNGD
jgi:hypothetical protein